MIDMRYLILLLMSIVLVGIDSPIGYGKPSAGSTDKLTDKEYRKQLLEFKKRKKLYLREHVTISRDLYNTMFSGKCDQENTANCWVLAALGAIPLEHRETLFRTSIKKVGNVFEIRLPMGSSKAKTIEVTADDLNPQAVVEKGEEKLYRPVNSSYGWQILEAAFTLHQFGRDSKGQVNRRASNFGKPYKALQELVPTRQKSLNIISNGTEPFFLNDARQEEILEKFSSYRPGICMYVASSLRKDPPYKLVARHAYVVHEINDSSNQVLLLDPYDSERPLVLTYEEFLKGFRRLYCLEIDLEETFR